MSKLDDLYRGIPAFGCRPGCTDCCGPVPFSAQEWARINPEERRKAKSLTCPYAGKRGCAIYERSPMVCRLFGASEDARLRCRHGCGPAIPLSIEATELLMREYELLSGSEFHVELPGNCP